MFHKTNSPNKTSYCFECITKELNSSQSNEFPHHFIPTSNLNSIIEIISKEVSKLQSEEEDNELINHYISKFEFTLSSFFSSQIKRTINDIILSNYQKSFSYEISNKSSLKEKLDFFTKKDKTKNDIQTAKCQALYKLQQFQEKLFESSNELSEKINTLLIEFFVSEKDKSEMCSFDKELNSLYTNIEKNPLLNQITKENQNLCQNAPPCLPPINQLNSFDKEKPSSPENKKDENISSTSSDISMVAPSKLNNCIDENINKGEEDGKEREKNYYKKIRKNLKKCYDCHKEFLISPNEMKYKWRCAECFSKYSKEKFFNGGHRTTNVKMSSVKYQKVNQVCVKCKKVFTVALVNSYKRKRCGNCIKEDIEKEKMKENNKNIPNEIETKVEIGSVMDFGNESEKEDNNGYI